MLLQISHTDILRTSFVDCATGAVAFRTNTYHPQRARSGSCSSASSSSSSALQEQLSGDENVDRVTSLEDAYGNILAEITWDGANASLIRVGDDLIKGTAELFDAAFVKIFPDATLFPTRLEYTWRMTLDDLLLLDDDEEVVGKLHQNQIQDDLKLAPAPSSKIGHDYLELNTLPEDELPEMLVCYLLLCTLRERMYSITRFVYGQPQKTDPIAKLRRGATRSIANLRNRFRRKAPNH
ncbi:hypothetical protein IEO21_05876 [Rhodonia placenta]|uniref:Uncharacterized protein n=1 Tax=Rhodonia placenta TaxID=104341 RepID=A0A8H7U1U5_9APHY|nr:hypothetical protein IEO21_05876 [Postia placenta]